MLQFPSGRQQRRLLFGNVEAVEPVGVPSDNVERQAKRNLVPIVGASLSPGFGFLGYGSHTDRTSAPDRG
jgi:hypothetical protein